MHKARWFVLLVLPLSMLACGLASGVQKIREAATELPAMLTEAPTALAPFETAAAKYTPEAAMTPSAGHLGIALDTPQQVMNVTQEFTFAPASVDGKPATIAKLTPEGEKTFQKLKGSVVQFIGDSKNLSKIAIITPSGDSETMGEASGLVALVASASLPAEAKVQFITWLATSFPKIQTDGAQQTTINGIQVSMKIDQGNYVVTFEPEEK